jgi:quercetin dioxygenase-like cupin family protein
MKRILGLVIAALAIAVLFFVLGEMMNKKVEATTADHGLFTPGDIKWMDAPSSLPPGAKLAILEGNPSEKGFFTMRLQMPEGYKIPPHWHSGVEHVTVISGTLNLGMGDKFDEKAGTTMPAGTFGFMPPQTKHFAWASEETVIQLHGVGPWTITYVNPSDDPRNMKK